jgi:hypothetical protein
MTPPGCRTQGKCLRCTRQICCAEDHKAVSQRVDAQIRPRTCCTRFGADSQDDARLFARSWLRQRLRVWA